MLTTELLLLHGKVTTLSICFMAVHIVYTIIVCMLYLHIAVNSQNVAETIVWEELFQRQEVTLVVNHLSEADIKAPHPARPAQLAQCTLISSPTKSFI